MKKTDRLIKELYCINVTRIGDDGSVSHDVITYNQYEQSFIREKWLGEKRYNYEQTMFGRLHTLMVVNFPIGDLELVSVRTFNFPENVNNAIKRDEVYHDTQIES